MARTGNIILTQMNNLSLESFEKKKSKTLEIWPVPKTYMLKLKQSSIVCKKINQFLKMFYSMQKADNLTAM